MNEPQTTVSVVDDDRSITDALREHLEIAGYQVATFASAEEFLASFDPDRPGCIILDERLPGMSGQALQQELVRRRSLSPIIFISAHAEVSMVVSTMRLGAITILQKPFGDEALLEAIGEAMEQDAAVRERHKNARSIESRFRGPQRHRKGTA